MKIGIIIPDRNDRPLFLQNCLRMINNQTIKPDIIELVNDTPLNFNGDGYSEPDKEICDITWRYRTGYDRLRNKRLDGILFMENDDWYAPNYIETMFKEWEKQGRPNVFGTNYTIYYHLKERGYFTMNHIHRSSAMSTLIKPDLKFNWCVDHEPFTDLHLWKVIKGITFNPGKHICMGIKHGIGLCGGRGHVDRLHRYSNNSPKDVDFSFLKQHMDEESFLFYTNYFN